MGLWTHRRFVAAVVMLLAMMLASGCSGRAAQPVLTPIAPPAQPDPADLSTPEAAVKSYTDWVSYAYRVLDSDVATHTFTPYEEVRVNSYVQYNIQEGKGLEQSLNKSSYRRTSSSESTVTLVGSEYWLYRYFASDGSKYLTGPTEASYDVTYTVVRQDKARWLVDRVRVTRLDPPESQ